MDCFILWLQHDHDDHHHHLLVTTSCTDMPVMALVIPSICIINCCPFRGIGEPEETILGGQVVVLNHGGESSSAVLMIENDETLCQNGKCRNN